MCIRDRLGVDPARMRIASKCPEGNKSFDDFSRISIEYRDAIASAKVGAAAKSEGDLVISGTKGYVYAVSYTHLIQLLSFTRNL